MIWDDGKIGFVEELKVLLLNGANRVLGLVNVSSGGVSGTAADPRINYVAALKANACAVIYRSIVSLITEITAL